MMNNNKILTVSYGTFSCTLEGFEDSFGTMKIIAEYFRDLAADDRYFGAEPPQPDAQMLARIAQTEVDRKVSAREQDGKIVLSALDSDVAPAAAAGAAALGMAAITAAQAKQAEATVEVTDAEDITLDAVATPIEETAETVIEEVAVEEVDAITTEEVVETVEAESSEIVAPQVEEIDATEEDTVEEEAESSVSDEDASDEEAVSEDDVSEDAVASETADDSGETDIVPGQPDAEVSAFFATEPVEDTVAPVEAPLADGSAPDSIAAKLQRIRAVVAQHDDVEEDEAYLEDEHAEVAETEETDAVLAEDADTAEDDAADLIAEARADLEDALEVDEAADAEALEAQDDADDVDAILNRLDADSAADDDAEAEEVVEDTAFEESVAESVNTFFETEEAKADAEEFAADAETDPAKMPLRKSRVIRVEPEEVEKVDAKRTRVIKVKRADLEAAIDKGDLEEYESASTGSETADTQSTDTPGLDDLAPAKTAETALSEDEQDELARELSALEEDIAREDSNTETADKSTPEEAPVGSNLTRRVVNSRGLLPEIDKGRGGAMTRLLAETDQQMDEPESATRRDAFAHLRAAVAAKKADDSMSKDTPGMSDADAYREDLAEAVKPRGTTTEHVADRQSDTPAPLKLVAEQRVDGEEAETTAPVAPRRIVSRTEAAEGTGESDNFAAFANEMGATTLPQLLEAAAAYMSFVEGRAQFSRPQLMTKVRQAGGQEDFSREEGLRSFGQLLRAGKIEKIKGGRFTVSDDIGYRPDQRAAG